MRTRRTCVVSNDEEGGEFANTLVEPVDTPEDKENRRATFTKKSRKRKNKAGLENVEEEVQNLTTAEDDFTNVLTETAVTSEDKENRRGTYTKRGRKGKKKSDKDQVEEELQKLTTTAEGDELPQPVLVETINTPEDEGNRRATFTKKGRKGKKKEAAAEDVPELTATDDNFQNSIPEEEKDVQEPEQRSTRRASNMRAKKGKKNVEKAPEVQKLATEEEEEEFTNSAVVEDLKPADNKETRRATYTRKGKKRRNNSNEVIIEDEEVKPTIAAPVPVVTPLVRRGTFTKSPPAPVAVVGPIKHETFDSTLTVTATQEASVRSPRTKLKEFSARQTKFSIGASPARKVSQEASSSSPQTKLKEFSARETKFSVGASPVRKFSQEASSSSPQTQLKEFSARETKFSIGASPVRKSSLPPFKVNPLTSKRVTPGLSPAVKPLSFSAFRKSYLSSANGSSSIKSRLLSSSRTVPLSAPGTPLRPVKGKSLGGNNSSAIKSTLFASRKSNLTASKTLLKNPPKTPLTKKTPLNKTKGPTPMPDFKKIHQKQIEKMENIVDYKKRTAARGLDLMSPIATKPNKTICRIPRPVRKSAMASTASPGGPFSRFGRPSDLKNPPTSTEKIREKERELLKGVRMNKRFMLQMQMRKLV